MIIVHAITSLEVGGAELTLKRLASAQRKKGHDVFVISLTKHGPLKKELGNLGIRVYSLNIIDFLSLLKSIYILSKILLKLRPDIIQTWLYHADLYVGIVSRLLGFKNIIWGVRSFDVSIAGNKKTIFIRWLCAKLSGFIPVSIVFAANSSLELHRKIGYKNRNMIFIPNGFDVIKKGSLNKKNISKNLRFDLARSFVIGFVGRYHHIKGIKYFVEAAGLLAKKNSRQVEFLMIGRGLDSENKELLRIIENTGLSNHFTLLGERSDIPY